MQHGADPKSRLESAIAELSGLVSTLSIGGSVTREEISSVVAAIRQAEFDLLGPRPRAERGNGARIRIRDYLVAHVGEAVPGDVLREISGIQEWARRVRELRVEEGYEITELGRSTYRLESPEPDAQRAEQWNLANSIRRQGGAAIGKIEEFLMANVGRVVTREQIDYVANIKEGSRRVRELRDEHGLPINSRIDEPDLSPDEYRLVSANPEDRRDVRQRLYPEDLRHKVFERDQFTCQSCKRDRAAAERAGDTRFYLEVHHRKALADELSGLDPAELNAAENLVTLCHSCHRSETEKLQASKRERRGKS